MPRGFKEGLDENLRDHHFCLSNRTLTGQHSSEERFRLEWHRSPRLRHVASNQFCVRPYSGQKLFPGLRRPLLHRSRHLEMRVFHHSREEGLEILPVQAAHLPQPRRRPLQKRMYMMIRRQMRR